MEPKGAKDQSVPHFMHQDAQQHGRDPEHHAGKVLPAADAENDRHQPKQRVDADRDAEQPEMKVAVSSPPVHQATR